MCMSCFLTVVLHIPIIFLCEQEISYELNVDCIYKNLDLPSDGFNSWWLEQCKQGHGACTSLEMLYFLQEIKVWHQKIYKMHQA